MSNYPLMNDDERSRCMRNNHLVCLHAASPLIRLLWIEYPESSAACQPGRIIARCRSLLYLYSVLCSKWHPELYGVQQRPSRELSGCKCLMLRRMWYASRLPLCILLQRISLPFPLSLRYPELARGCERIQGQIGVDTE